MPRLAGGWAAGRQVRGAQVLQLGLGRLDDDALPLRAAGLRGGEGAGASGAAQVYLWGLRHREERASRLVFLPPAPAPGTLVGAGGADGGGEDGGGGGGGDERRFWAGADRVWLHGAEVLAATAADAADGDSGSEGGNGDGAAPGRGEAEDAPGGSGPAPAGGSLQVGWGPLPAWGGSGLEPGGGGDLASSPSPSLARGHETNRRLDTWASGRLFND